MTSPIDPSNYIQSGENAPNPVRLVKNEAYLPVLEALLRDGKKVNLRISGSSMSPFLIHQRDVVYLSPVEKPLRRGDIVFYRRSSGQYVLHRIHHIGKDGLYIVGDAQVEIEGPVQPDQVFGVVHQVLRKGKRLDRHNFWWQFFEKVWIRIVPLRYLLWGCYGKLTRH